MSRGFVKKIYAVCGGFHMKDNVSEENEKIVAAFVRTGVKKLFLLIALAPRRLRFLKTFLEKII